MSEEEKQLENNSQPNVSGQEHDQATVAPEVELITENDGEQTETKEELAATTVAAEMEETTSAGSDAAIEVESIVSDLQRENEMLKTQLEEIKSQSDSLKSQSMRIAADFDNFRKRTSKEKEELEHQIKRNTITELLPVVDNFERARSHLKPQTEGELTIHKSYQGVYKQLVDCLKRIGVSPMRPEGQEFDPNLHEAVMREATDEYPEGTVTEQLMRGYMLNDRVLRHAMVKVAAAGESSRQDVDQEADSTE